VGPANLVFFFNRWVYLWIATAFAITLGSLQSQAASTYVGSESCRRCHVDVYSTFFKNPHYAAYAKAGDVPEKSGCESCHGPASEHIKKPQKANILAFSEAKPKQILDSCLTCHAKQISRDNIRRSSHTVNDVTCNSCHNIHKPKSDRRLLSNVQNELCYSCHSQVRAQFNMPFKHRVNEGFMQCSDCHNPHGTNAPTWRMASRPRMVDQALGNEQACLKCHVAQRGPFTFEHAAVRVDGCESCHSPHGSINARLLKRPVVFTQCLECHTGIGNTGRQGDGVQNPSGSHNLANPRYQNCTTCHVKIHGSNSSELFLH
jgi:DmsE family decaheme c-type cytochrome